MRGWAFSRWFGISARMLICGSLCLPMYDAIAASGPAQAISPPGSEHDPPPEGVSLFDQLFGHQATDGIVHSVPYPFERLLATLKHHTYSLETVLIPLGRSLHREAARPEYFRYPRIVVAVDRQSGDRIPTRDRLFLGYQEKAQQIEVISYNETAGRFEFQVVSDYAAGARPAVKYARRALCVSCHQNGAPIFPRRPWSETSSDPKVAERIRAHRPSPYHGVATAGTTGDAGFIDTATQRANLLSSYQRIWREGCELPGDRSASRRCRADAFHAMLRYRLGVWSEGTPNATAQHEAYRSVVTEVWRERWPAGLAIPEAHIPNRSPPLEALTTHVQPRFDPLSPRPPRVRWMAERSVDRAIEGLADAFLLKTDIERLDRELRRRSRTPEIASVTYGGDCEVERAPFASSNGETWISIHCAHSADPDPRFDLVAELVVNPNGVLHRGLSWLYLSDRRSAVYAGLSGEIKQAPAGGTTTARLSLSRRWETIRARTWDGTAMAGIEFAWDTGATGEPNSPVVNGRFALELSHDLGSVADAIAALLRDAETGTFDGFDQRAVRGVALMDALFDKLGMEYAAAPTSIRIALGEGESDMVEMGSASPDDRTVALFRRHCGTCHGSPTVSPPGFLAGNSEQVLGNLLACAERINFRLAMWQTRPGERPRTPMPPAAYLDTASLDAGQWLDSDEYRALREQAAGLLGSAGKPLPKADYAELPPCLPAYTYRAGGTGSRQVSE